MPASRSRICAKIIVENEGFGHPRSHAGSCRAVLTAMVAALCLSAGLLVAITVLSIRVAAAMVPA